MPSVPYQECGGSTTRQWQPLDHPRQLSPLPGERLQAFGQHRLARTLEYIMPLRAPKAQLPRSANRLDDASTITRGAELSDHAFFARAQVSNWHSRAMPRSIASGRY